MVAEKPQLSALLADHVTVFVCPLDQGSTLQVIGPAVITGGLLDTVRTPEVEVVLPVALVQVSENWY